MSLLLLKKIYFFQENFLYWLVSNAVVDVIFEFSFFRRFFFRKILRLFLSFKHSILMLMNLVLLAWHEPFLQFSSYNNKLCFLYGRLYPFAFIYNVYSLFIDKSRISSKIEEHLELSSEDCLLKVYAYEDIQEELRRLGQMEKKIWVNHRRCFIPAGNYMFKVNNRNSTTFYEICSTASSNVSIVNFERVSASCCMCCFNPLHANVPFLYHL